MYHKQYFKFNYPIKTISILKALKSYFYKIMHLKLLSFKEYLKITNLTKATQLPIINIS
jgi:hypothetical protein